MRGSWTRLIGRLAREAGVAVEILPMGLRTRVRGAYRFVFNYGPQPADASALLAGDLVLGERVLPVGGVAVARAVR